MQGFQKFSIFQSLNYAFRTYFRNYNFFAKIFAMAVISSFCLYFGEAYFSTAFEKNFIVIQLIFWFAADLILNVLLINNYDNLKPLRFGDFFNYDFSLGYYLLYYILVNLIISNIMNIIPSFFSQISILPYPKNAIFVLCLGLVWSLGLYLYIKFFLGKYLILDKHLTFIQSIKATPDLVYNEKSKLAWSWAVCGLITILAVVPLICLGSYLIFGSFNKNYLALIGFPIMTAFSYPISIMVFVSIYKQLMANADEKVKNELASFAKLNNSEKSESENDEDL